MGLKKSRYLKLYTNYIFKKKTEGTGVHATVGADTRRNPGSSDNIRFVVTRPRSCRYKNGIHRGVLLYCTRVLFIRTVRAIITMGGRKVNHGLCAASVSIT